MLRKWLFRLLFGRPRAVFTTSAPHPVGPYSQAIVVGGLVFGAGQLGIDPATGTIPGATAAEQMIQALRNMEAVLAASGSARSGVVKVTLYFKDLADYGQVNAAYEQFFRGHKPARLAVQVSLIPLGGLVKPDYIAVS